MHYRRYFLSCIIFFIISAHAQSAIIFGTIHDGNGEVLPNAHMTLSNGRSTQSDSQGVFEFRDLAKGFYTITAQSVGYVKSEKQIKLSTSEQLQVDFVLISKDYELEQVKVLVNTEADELEQSTANVSVLETKEFYARNVNTSDALKQISGINVRQTGGYGSNANLFINGMSGKQIKIFLDGIPLSYLGSGMALNVLPLFFMKRIEVYKGVVPVYLGADALGGAINVIPRKKYNSYVDAAYSFGSFNTHKFNLSAQVRIPGKKWIFGINSFHNSSDNNYEVDVEIPNKFGNPESASVRRFHDRYANYLISAYAGVIDSKAADRLIIHARISGIHDEIQHNAVMTEPYGEALYIESARGLSLDYEKENLLKKTDIKWYCGLNKIEGLLTDTTLNVYTWDGHVFYRRESGGEIATSKNLLELNTDNLVNRLNITREIGEKGALTFNVLSSWFRRVGKDDVAVEFYGFDPFTSPTTLTKNALGLAYEHKFKKSLISYTFLKHYDYRSIGYVIENKIAHFHSQKVSNFGVGQALTCPVFKHYFLKASYEYATRLPDEVELFGDFTTPVNPNPSLKPEQSHNMNLGLRFNNNKLKYELNGFYRSIQNGTWVRASQFHARYENLLKGLIRGVEAQVNIKPNKHFVITANVTYQDLTNRSRKDVTGATDESYFGARIPDRPFLFGNAVLQFNKKDLIVSKSLFSIWWSSSYVHEYFLYWANDGNRAYKHRIPYQFVQGAGVSYTLPKEKAVLTLELSNIFNQKVYDNFSVQRPGRALYATIRTSFNNKS